MAEPSKERMLERLRQQGLLADDEVREARRLLEEAERAGAPLALAEALLRAGALAAKAHHVAAAMEAGEAPAEADELAAPEIGGSGLQMLERIGRGSQAIVYKCRQVDMDRVVAVKVLLPSAAGDAESRARFIREARSAGRLSHPNIVTIHEIRPLKHTICIVMEYLDGGSVGELLKGRKRLDPAEAVLIVRQVAEGLRAAHALGFIHRDIKPRNILLTGDGTVKLADMGLARHASRADEQEGKAYGTPYYISPEQVTGDPPVDFRTDIYSLGVTLYEMVTGRPPFVAPTPQEIMRMHVIAPPPDPREVVPDLPQALCWLIAKMMAREPEDRYASAADLVAALDELDLASGEDGAGMPVAEVVPTAQVVPAAGSDGWGPGRPGAARPAAAHAARGHGAETGPAEAKGRGGGKGLLVGLLVFFLVAAGGTAIVLFVFGSSLFKAPPAPKGPAPVAPVPGPVAVEVSPEERSARVALESAKALEKMPSAEPRDVIRAYENVVTFYPDTRAAAEADVAAKRLRAAQAFKVPAPPKPPPKPKTTTPAPAKPAPPAAEAEERPLPEPVPPGSSDVEVAADGTVTARADKATIHGGGARYEKAGDRDNIGFWNDPGTWVSWEVPSARAGTYALELVYAADQGNGGEIKVSVGDESVRHTVEVTGGWGTFRTKRVGTVRLPRTGPVTIAVSPMRIHGGGVMNLQAVRLVPEK